MKHTTAQDASGSTIGTRDDLRVAVFLGAGDPETPYGTSRAGIGGRGRKTLGADQKAVDADGPVDAQNAPTAPWKTADGFPQAPTASIVCTDRRRQDTASDRASDNYRVPLRSPAALPSLILRRQK